MGEGVLCVGPISLSARRVARLVEGAFLDAPDSTQIMARAPARGEDFSRYLRTSRSPLRPEDAGALTRLSKSRQVQQATGSPSSDEPALSNNRGRITGGGAADAPRNNYASAAMSDSDFLGDYQSADSSGKKNCRAFIYYGPGQRRRLTLPASANQAPRDPPAPPEANRPEADPAAATDPRRYKRL